MEDLGVPSPWLLEEDHDEDIWAAEAEKNIRTDLLRNQEAAN